MTDILNLMKNRVSTRGFLDKEVDEATVTKILDAARWAPSGVNIQPWKVVVVSGETKARLGEALSEARTDGVEQSADFPYYPEKWSEPYGSRRKACGLALFKALEIGREDNEKRMAAWVANYRFFDAPVGLLFFMSRRLTEGSLLDYGMFLQSVMLAAEVYGLSTCPQAALAEYPDIVRKIVDMDDSFALVCGMSLGYSDPDHPANSYRTEREEVDSFAEWRK